MPKVKCIGKNYILEVESEGITYECMVSEDLRNLFDCIPEPEDRVNIENIIQDAAFNLEVEDLDNY